MRTCDILRMRGKRWHRMRQASKYLACALLAVGLTERTGRGGVGDPLDTSRFRYQMQIGFSGYTGPGTLTDIPVLVVLGTNIAGFSYSQAKTDGSDLRFADSNGRELAYERELWDRAGRSFLWVRIPSLASSSASFQAFWGNPAASAPSYTTNGSAWEPGFVGVWHMGQQHALDSTANANSGTGSSNTTVAAHVGMGQAFSGASYIAINKTADDITGAGAALSLSALVKTTDPDGSGAGASVISATSSARAGRLWLRYGPASGPGNGEPCVSEGNSQTVEADTNTRIDDGTWHLLDYTRNDTEGLLYIDGVQKATHAAGGYTLATNDLWSIGQMWVGLSSSPARFLVGTLDEVRVSDVARSAAWVKACWDMVKPGSTFLSYGAVQSTPETATTLYGW